MTKINRLYNCEVPLFGITGNIASGKSTVTNILREKGEVVLCADEFIKNLYKNQETIEFIKSLNQSFVNSKDEIIFSTLRETFFNDDRTAKVAHRGTQHSQNKTGRQGQCSSINAREWMQEAASLYSTVSNLETRGDLKWIY